MPPPIVLHVVSELYPFTKTGGLADVAAALPVALRSRGVDARVVVPGYPGVLRSAVTADALWDDPNLFGGGPARLVLAELRGFDVPAYVLECPGLFGRQGGPYADTEGREWPDNHRRFAALGWAAARLLASIRGPAVLHAHDWQAGLAVAHAKLQGTSHPCVTTVHNISYPGSFDPSVFPELGLPSHAYSIHGVEFYGRVSFLKAALFYADHVTTVSPTYAQEIQQLDHGGGFEGLLAGRPDRLTGILNGIDTREWDPASDRFVTSHFDASQLDGKEGARDALCKRMGLAAVPGLLVGAVARLVSHKGMDWLLESVPWLVQEGGSVVVLGSGDRNLEEGFRSFARLYPGRVSVHVGYDEGLAHLVQAGSDVICVPSRSEPCGLTQLYAQRYGSPPVVRRTGGLADTVTDATPKALDAGTATGFVFERSDAKALQEALGRAVALRRTSDAWTSLQRAGMAKDFGWGASAARYTTLYESVLASGPR